MTNTKQEHTELPYFTVKKSGRMHTTWNVEPSLKDTGDFVCECDTKQDANFIVKACNNHYKLLEACKRAEKRLLDLGQGVDSKNTLDILKQAIKESEG